MIKELKKITFPSPKELLSSFGTVIAFSAFMTALIYLIDSAATLVQQAILSLM